MAGTRYDSATLRFVEWIFFQIDENLPCLTQLDGAGLTLEIVVQSAWRYIYVDVFP